MDRLAVVVLFALFALLAIALPLVRSWLRDGTIALVAHRGDGVEGVTGRAFFGAVVGYALWAVAYAIGWVSAATPPLPIAVAGWLAIGVGLVIVVVAQAQMGRSWRIGIDQAPTELVQSGLYRVVRNPIYTGIFWFLGGLALVAPSAWTGLGALVTAVVIDIQVRVEENHLRAQHGARFEAYAARTGRYVPRLV